MDYFDILLAKKLEDDRDPKVEGLSVSANGRYHEDGVVYDPVIVNVPETPLSKLTVTENGTYTAPSGTAYNEVEVDVPLPENAYLLKDIPNTPTAIASFEDGANLPMPKLEVGIEPIQDLHGYANPWAGGSGANKWDEQWESGTYNINTGSKTTDVSRIRSKNPIKVSANTTYYFVKLSGKLVYLYYYDSNNDFISYVDPFQTSGTGGTFSTPSNAEYLCFSILQTSYSSGIAVNYPSSVTSYTPYENECPISGWDEVNVSVSGKNLFDVSSLVQGGISADGTTFNNPAFPQYRRTPYMYLPAGSYIITRKVATDWWKCYLYDMGKNPIGTTYYFNKGNTLSERITLDRNCYIRFAFDYTPTSEDETQLELGSTATAYEPYNGTTYTIDLDGTRYGGKVDLVSGVMTVEKAYVDMGDLSYIYDSANLRFQTTITGIKRYLNNVPFNAICEIYKTVSANDFDTNRPDSAIRGNQGNDVIFVRDTRFTTSSSLINEISGKKLVYELATPLTIQLSPTVVKSLEGVNNVWADCGDILDLSYLAKEV